MAGLGYLDLTGELPYSDTEVDEPFLWVLHTPFLHILCTQIPFVQEEDDLEWEELDEDAVGLQPGPVQGTGRGS